MMLKMKQQKKDRIFVLHHSLNIDTVLAISDRIEKELGEECCTCESVDTSEAASLFNHINVCDVFIYIYSYTKSQFDSSYSKTAMQ